MSVYGSPFGDFCSRTTIPYFSGEHVEWWIYHVECFFYHRLVIPEQKLRLGEVYFTGEALRWYHEWIRNAQRSWRRFTWEDFVADLRNRFTRPDAVSTQAEELDFFNKTLDEIKHNLAELQALTSACLSNLSNLNSQNNSNSISKLIVAADKSLNPVNECIDGFVPQVSVSDDGQLQRATKDTIEAISTIHESTDETKVISATSKISELKLEVDYVVSLQPIIQQTQGIPTKVHSSHLPVIIFHDDVKHITNKGIEESGYVASSVVLDASSFFCTLGVCENVYEAFLYLKLKCHWYQRENIYMVVKVVSFLLDWVEKPPPFPPDLTRSISIYHGCLSLIEVKCIRMRDYGFGLNLCFVLDVVLLVFEEDYYSHRHGLGHVGNKPEVVSKSHCSLMPKVDPVFHQPKDGSACRILKAIQCGTRYDDRTMTLMLEIASIQGVDIWLKLIVVADGSIVMGLSHNFNIKYLMKWTLILLGNEWYL